MTSMINLKSHKFLSYIYNYEILMRSEWTNVKAPMSDTSVRSSQVIGLGYKKPPS